MSFQTVSARLTADLTTSGTFTVGYPSGTTKGQFAQGTAHKLRLGQSDLRSPADFTLSLGASSVTVTYNGTTTIPAGTPYHFQFDMPAKDQGPFGGLIAYGSAYPRVFDVPTVLVDLGTPATKSATAILATTAVADATTHALSSVYSMDVPRNFEVKSSDAGDTTQTITITGTDDYGVTLVETATLNGTSAVLGLKAFKTIVSYKASAALAGNLSIGTGNKLGIPIYLPNSVFVLKELQDGAAPSSGTITAGLSVNTAPSATNADVRGTYLPNATADGSKGFQLLLAVPDPSFKGNTQYGG